jgi:hypothetical protein
MHVIVHEQTFTDFDTPVGLQMDDSGWSLYSAAHVFAVSATTPGFDPKRAEQYAARAGELLRKAVEKKAISSLKT